MNRVPIYYNEDFITTDYLYDLMVVVGTDSTGKIALQLVKNNEIIYGPNCELQAKFWSSNNCRIFYHSF